MYHLDQHFLFIPCRVLIFYLALSICCKIWVRNMSVQIAVRRAEHSTATRCCGAMACHMDDVIFIVKNRMKIGNERAVRWICHQASQIVYFFQRKILYQINERMSVKGTFIGTQHFAHFTLLAIDFGWTDHVVCVCVTRFALN